MDDQKEPGGGSPSVGLAEISSRFSIPMEDLNAIHKVFPLKISRSFFNRIKSKNDALYRQVVPDEAELTASAPSDPLSEDDDSPTPNIVHRYPDRCLFLVEHSCASYCRFCTRKRKVGDPSKIRRDGWDSALAYIESRPEIRDVVVSGGDPLMMPVSELDSLLGRLRSIPHIEILRVGTRAPNFSPEIITSELTEMLRRHQPLYVNIHFNHPDEVDSEVEKALGRLADAGIPLGSQTVLLKGVNDDPEVMRVLMQRLLKCRVRPYYIYQADLVDGTEHFRTPVETGLDIVKSIRGWTSGLAVPHYVIDAPGGGGKIPLLPDYLQRLDTEEAVLRNYKDREYVYKQVRINRC